MNSDLIEAVHMFFCVLLWLKVDLLLLSGRNFARSISLALQNSFLHLWMMVLIVVQML